MLDSEQEARLSSCRTQVPPWSTEGVGLNYTETTLAGQHPQGKMCVCESGAMQPVWAALEQGEGSATDAATDAATAEKRDSGGFAATVTL